MQTNCAYYSALGDADEAYLLARAIQFFTPGIPLVYYVGLLAGANDIESVERTKVGREINRHMFDDGEAREQLERPVVKVRHALRSMAALRIQGCEGSNFI
jgi:sucrose phosphorylase